MFKCPNCKKTANRVLVSRAIEGGAAIRRRRLCYECEHRWTTYEDYSPEAKAFANRDSTTAGVKINSEIRHELQRSVESLNKLPPISNPETLDDYIDRLGEETE
jgi:transcriptional regulator NrdR family protein